MDLKAFNGVWKLKRFCMTCMELIFKLLSCEFCFQFEFFFYFDCQTHKTHLKSFSFVILFIGDYSPTSFFFMTNFEVYNVFMYVISKMTYISVKTSSIPLP